MDLTHALVTAGGVAGFAAAFRTPIAAILYMLEEVATPENWKNKSTAFSCIAAAFGVLVTTGIIKLIEGAGTLSYSSIIIYSADTKLSDLAWTYKDAVGFTVVTVLAGLSAGAVTRAGLALNKYRAAARWRRSAEAKIAEAGVVAALTVLVCCLMPLTGSCKPYINEHDYGDLGYGDDHSQEGEGADDHHFRRLDVGGEHYYNRFPTRIHFYLRSSFFIYCGLVSLAKTTRSSRSSRYASLDTTAYVQRICTKNGAQFIWQIAFRMNIRKLLSRIFEEVALRDSSLVNSFHPLSLTLSTLSDFSFFFHSLHSLFHSLALSLSLSVVFCPSSQKHRVPEFGGRGGRDSPPPRARRGLAVRARLARHLPRPLRALHRCRLRPRRPGRDLRAPHAPGRCVCVKLPRRREVHNPPVEPLLRGIH
mmetsp:Transcript_60919/g.137748  ORF Transcript_60919/g.137748 Transcript_60919/m.137748 type:complete len:420 (+) Transcript_60919:922-2181(+)